jgi:chemotaxis protein methyltransferase CheR
MIPANQDPELTTEEFVLFRDFIHEKAGIFFADNKMYLVKNRLARRINDLGIKSYKDYFYRVKYDVSMTEFNQLMNLITTNETSFFRNPPQLKSFSDESLPLITKEKIQSKGNRTLKIWSAGCSTGEEPYTLSIIVLEHLKSLAGWNVEIVASDISEQVLQSARQGIYGDMTLRSTSRDLVQRYFMQQGDKYQVKPEVKNLVRFGYLNLNDSRKMSMFSGMDFIFCRNVMIYFSDEVKRQIVRGFYDALVPGGYLYIGHSESLHGISKAFKLVYFKNGLVYHKEAKKSAFGKDEPVATANGSSKALDLLRQIKTGAGK